MNFSPFPCPIFLGHPEARGRCYASAMIWRSPRRAAQSTHSLLSDPDTSLIPLSNSVQGEIAPKGFNALLHLKGSLSASGDFLRFGRRAEKRSYGQHHCHWHRSRGASSFPSASVLDFPTLSSGLTVVSPAEHSLGEGSFLVDTWGTYFGPRRRPRWANMSRAGSWTCSLDLRFADSWVLLDAQFLSYDRIHGGRQGPARAYLLLVFLFSAPHRRHRNHHFLCLDRRPRLGSRVRRSRSSL